MPGWLVSAARASAASAVEVRPETGRSGTVLRPLVQRLDDPDHPAARAWRRAYGVTRSAHVALLARRLESSLGLREGGPAVAQRALRSSLCTLTSSRFCDLVHWLVQPVHLALGAICPLDADCDRDGVAVLADVEAVELAAPLVGCVLDGLPVHASVSNRCMFA
jgi:hypothetical protein